MKEKITPKDFALSQIAPYYADPNTCGYDGKHCCYLTNEGKMCVAGKNMIDPSLFGTGIGIYSLIREYGQRIFKSEVRDILTSEQWSNLQAIHDTIANDNFLMLNECISKLGLFTIEELKEAANNLNK